MQYGFTTALLIFKAIVFLDSAKLRSDYGDIPPKEIYEWAKAHMRDDADALVIAGGGFRVIGTIDALEKALNRPFLSTNQASFWCALNISGVTDQIRGYGGLFNTELQIR